jgi:hypothetical protein
MIKTKKISKHIDKPIDVPKVEPDRIKGYDLIPKLYCTIFCCAKKESGKTNAIFKILKECTGKKTILYLISSTVYNDDNYIEIVKYFENKGIQVITHTSIEEADLDQLINEQEEQAKQEIADKKNPKKVEQKPNISSLCFGDEEKEKKEKKEKKVAPKYVFVFDDLSAELRNKQISALIKKHRHFRTKIICSSQYPNDLAPEARKNIDYYILFAGHSLNKLEELYNNMDLQISFPLFVSLYQNATSKPYSFLFVDEHKGIFRKNFNTEYQIEGSQFFLN